MDTYLLEKEKSLCLTYKQEINHELGSGGKVAIADKRLMNLGCILEN